MPKIARVSNTSRIGIRLFDGDLDRVRKYYPTMPYTLVIRKLVQNHLDQLDAKLEKRFKIVLPSPSEERK